MTEWLALPLLQGALNGLWQGTIATGLVWGWLRLRPRMSSATRYVAWWMALLVIAGVTIHGAVERPVRLAGSGDAQLAAPSTTSGGVAFPTVVEPAAEATRGTTGRSTPLRIPPALAQAALLAWLSGCLGLLVGLCLDASGIRSLRREAVSLPPELERGLRALVARTGIRRRVTFGLSRRVGGPAMLGWSRPVILFPPALLFALDEDERERLVAHELAHVARWDDWLVLFQRVLGTALFFNPLVHRIGRWLEAERERACDEWAIVHTGAPRVAYAGLLLRLHDLGIGRPSAALSPPGVTQIETRTRALLDHRRPLAERASRRTALGMAMAASLLVVTPAAGPAIGLAYVAAPPNRASAALRAVDRSGAPGRVGTGTDAGDSGANGTPSRPTGPPSRPPPTIRRGAGELSHVRDGPTPRVRSVADGPRARAEAAFALSRLRRGAASEVPWLVGLLGDHRPVPRAPGSLSEVWGRPEERAGWTTPAEEAAKALLYIGVPALAPFEAAVERLGGDAGPFTRWALELLRGFD